MRWVIQDRRPPIWTEGGYGREARPAPAAQGTGHVHRGGPGAAHQGRPALPEYTQKVWAGTEELFAAATPELLDKTVTVKPLGDMSVVQCLGQVGLTHGMTHLGEIELARTLVGALIGRRHALRLADPRALAVGGRRLRGHRRAARPGVPGRGRRLRRRLAHRAQLHRRGRLLRSDPVRERAGRAHLARAHRLRGDPARAPPSGPPGRAARAARQPEPRAPRRGGRPRLALQRVRVRRLRAAQRRQPRAQRARPSRS